MSNDHQEPREYFISRLAEQVGELEEEVNELEVRLEDADWDPKLDYDKQIDELKLGLRDARESLNELESAGRKGWSALYKEVEAGLGALMTRIQDFRTALDGFLID